MSVSRFRRWGAGAVLVTAAVALSGCGPVEAGSAAIVGDRRISARELEQATADINTFLGPDNPVSEQALLFDLIISPYVIKRAAAVKAGVLASEADARKELVAKVPHPSDAAIEVVRVELSLNRVQQLGQQAQNQETVQYVYSGVQNDLKNVDIDVNPRYGTFDKTKMTVTEAVRNWLPTPTPTPAAATGGDGTQGGGAQPTP